MDRLVTRLLDLPNGIHFLKFRFLWDVKSGVQWVMALVEACSDSLEHIDLETRVDGKPCHSLPPAARSVSDLDIRLN